MCIMPFRVLSFCDFLGAMVSFWVTIVTMARLPLHWTSFSYVVAILALAIGVEWDKHSLLTFLVPSVVAMLIMVVAWVSVNCCDVLSIMQIPTGGSFREMELCA